MSTDPRFAEPTPFARLVYAQAAGACGDACILVSMAGSIFFSSPTSAARGKVLLFLLITMTPFVIVAPVLGPALDRMKGGRRLFLILSAAGRAVLCLALAMYISKPAPEGLLVYPLAFGVLVLQKGSTIAKSALVPGAGEGRRRARHRQLAPRAHQRGRRVRRRGYPRSWCTSSSAPTGRCASARSCSSIATILAIQIPRTRLRAPADEQQQKLERERDAHAEHPARFERVGRVASERRLLGVLRRVLAQARSRSRWAWPARRPTSATSAVCSSRPRFVAPVREEVILASSLVLPAAFTLLGALVAGSVGFVLAAFTLGIGAAAGRLGFDSLLQRDGPDAVRGRAFAKFETRFQLVWVIGGMIAIIPFAKQMGLFLLAVVLGFAAVSYVAALRAARGRVMRTKLLPEAVDRQDLTLARPRRRPGEASVPQVGAGRRPTHRPREP